MSMITSSNLIIIFALVFVIIFVNIKNPIQWKEIRIIQALKKEDGKHG